MTLVARDGFPAATTAAIAETAGVAEGTLYRHFPSKDDLLIETYRGMKAQMAAAVQDAFDPDEAIPLRLARFWRAIYDAYLADPDAFLFAQRFGQSELARREGGEATQRFKETLTRLFAEGVATGVLREAPHDLFALMFLSSATTLLRETVDGRRWTEAELQVAADAAVTAWLRPPAEIGTSSRRP
jgi:AcrR family transcriptional regulator